MLARALACGSPSSQTITTRCLAASPSVHGRARELARRGHEVTIVTGHLLRTPPIADRTRGRCRRGFGSSARLGRPLYGLADDPHRARRPRPATARLFKRLKVDVVHLHAPYNLSMRDRPARHSRQGRRRAAPLRVRTGRAARRVRPDPAALARPARRARRRLEACIGSSPVLPFSLASSRTASTSPLLPD